MLLRSIINGFFTAFAMYSAIPMPQGDWDENTMKYALCFFPWVGVVIGFAVYGWYLLCGAWGIGSLLFAGVLVLLPLLISGGIHLDGFIDTADALSSRQPQERKLEILKDPHVGAFGVILCVCYLLLQFSLWAQLYEAPQFFLLLPFGYVLSRSLCGFGVISFTNARSSGLAHAFSSTGAKRPVQVTMVIYVLVVFALFLQISLGLGAAAILVTLVWLGLFHRLCRKQFGGITGDLAGYFLQILELLLLFVAVGGGLLG